MNQTVMSGNLTADIESKEVGEDHLSKFTLACNQGEKVVFLPVEAWNMEHLGEYLRKGSRVLVSGALRQDQWENKEGERRSRLVLRAYQVEFLDAPRNRAKMEKAPRRSGRASRSAA
ncbi:MAG: single-stranded DNA-binding protein [Puniceicoccales bacterium]